MARALPSLNLNHSLEDDRQYSGICFTNTQLITDSFHCSDRGLIYFFLHLVNGTGYCNSVSRMTRNSIRHLTLRTLVISTPCTSHDHHPEPKRGNPRL